MIKILLHLIITKSIILKQKINLIYNHSKNKIKNNNKMINKKIIKHRSKIKIKY